MAPATSISAFDATFAQGLIEACVQLATGAEAVLLVAYDSASAGPLMKTSRSEGLLGGALVLSRRDGGPRLGLSLRDGEAGEPAGALAQRAPHNAMRPMLPLFESLAAQASHCTLNAGPGRVLDVEMLHG
jgi:hypothetical protein